MAYYLIKNYSRSGKIGIADKVFERIVTNVLAEAKNAEVYRKRKIFRPKSISIIRKGSELKINVMISLSECADVTAETQYLEEKISSTIYYLTELMPTKVNIKVEEIKKI